MRLEIPQRGKLQQGMIFSCCAVSGYPDKEAWGLVITARCDLAVGKMPVLNYLPVVKFEDWIQNEGLAVLRGRAWAESEGELDGLLRELSIPKTVLLGTSEEIVLNAAVDAFEERQRKTWSQRVERVLTKRRVASEAGLSELKRLFPKIYTSVVKELMTHRLAGYYYLPCVEVGAESGCFVVLLRQIGSMPIELARELPGGKRKVEISVPFPRVDQYLYFATSEEVALPVGVVPSPHIEHLLQAFSLLFGRIGLPDPDPKHVERFSNPEVS